MIQSRIIPSASFSEDEIIVSNILLNLKDLIEESESHSQVTPLKLSSSKKRRCDRNLGFNSPSPNSVQRNSQVEDDESDDVEIKLKSKAIRHDTPLSFSLTEFDDKSKQYSSQNHKSSKRKRREKLMSNIEKLTRCRESLREEVEKVKSYYNKQKAYNLELKAMSKKVMTNLNGQETETSHMSQYPMGQLSQTQPMFSSGNGLGFVNYSGPVIDIPNLNVFTMNSLSPFEHNKDTAERKAQYAEARRKRRMKQIEIKRSFSLIRPTKR